MDHKKVLYLCGMEIPSLIISPSNMLEVVFRSDWILESTGFRAVYTGNTIGSISCIMSFGLTAATPYRYRKHLNIHIYSSSLSECDSPKCVVILNWCL